MLAGRRRALITAHVQRHGSVRVRELTTELGVSDMTIRRDLDALTQEGVLTKVHGGATLLGDVQPTTLEPGFLAKSSEQIDEKRAIAATAAGLVHAGTAIGLTAGTTTWHLANQLAGIADLVVVTNSARIFERLQADERPDRTVMLIGGIQTPSDALVGPLAVQALGTLHLDQVFLGVHGMSERAGYTTPNLLEADTNRAFVEASQRLIVVADHSKWQTVGLASIAPLAAADTVITDDALDAAGVETLRKHAGNVIVCPVDRP